MMRRVIRLTVSLLSAGLLVFVGLARVADGQDRGEAKATIGKANVTIEYGRPSLKGRDPLKMMQPGSVWRLGSNASTTISSDADLDFGGTRVPKGKHIFLASLGEDGKWSLLVSGKSAFQYEPGARIAEVPMELKEAEESVEQLTIDLADQGGRGVVEIAWGTSRLVASFAPAK